MKLPGWARANPDYVLALDEAGLKTIKPSTDRHVFAFGGVVLPYRSLNTAREQWSAWCTSYGLDDPKAKSLQDALLGWQEDEVARLDLFQGFVSVVMDNLNALPVIALVRKEEAGSYLLVPTRSGRFNVDQRKLGEVLYWTFEVFLKRHDARGLMRCDQLGSPAEQEALATALAAARVTMTEQGKTPRRVDKRVEFVRSHDSPEVQMAGVMVALLQRLHERVVPLRKGMCELMQKAEAKGLRVVHLS